jgi:hypothetical protein
MTKHWGNWDAGAVVIGILASLLAILSFFSRPTFTVANHVVVITQGIVAGAVIMGALFWAAIEVFTKPGEGLVDLLVRSVGGFVLGGLVGGLMAYLFNFGQYLLVPAFAGNPAAIYELLAVFFAGIVLIWDAAWSHSRAYVRWGGT